MTTPAYQISSNASATILLSNNESVVVDAGVRIIDASVNPSIRTSGMAGIGNAKGGGNTVTDFGLIEGFVGAWFRAGSNTVVVQNGGEIYGWNAGVEFHNHSHNVLTVAAGGDVSSHDYGVWCGNVPNLDYSVFPDTGYNTINNAGTIEGVALEAIRMVEGGNHINNTGTIKSDDAQAIQINSAVTSPGNFIVNTGTISAGAHEPAVVSGDAAMTITNNGTINGDIDFGAGNDTYQGAGLLHGVLNGGAGNDTLIGGAANQTFDGGTGGDDMVCGTGVNTFIYAGAADSSDHNGTDVIDGFNFSRNHIVVAGKTISSFAVIHAATALQAHHAAVLETSSGISLVIDENGQAGYQAGADLVITLTHAVHIPGMS